MADTNYYIDLDAVTNGDGSIGSPLNTFPASDALAGVIASGDRVIFNVSGATQATLTAVWNLATAGWQGPGILIFQGDQPNNNVISTSHARVALYNTSLPLILPVTGGAKVEFHNIGIYWTRNNNGDMFKHLSQVAGMNITIRCPIRSLYPAATSKPGIYSADGDTSNAYTVNIEQSSFGAGFIRLITANYARALTATVDKISAAEFSGAFGTINSTATVSLTDSAIVSCPSYANVDTIDNCATTGGTGTNAVTIADFSGEFVSLTAGSEDFTLQNDSALLYAGSDGNHIGSDQAVEVAPSFTTQPSTGSVVEGDAGSTHTFTVVAVGPPAVTSYQWQKDDQGDNNFVNITGATSNTLEIAGDDVTVSANNGDQYRCVATNSIDSTNSNAVALTVTSASYLITPPAQIRRGEAFDVTITTSGTAPDTADTATIDGESLTVNSVTGAGPEYTMNLTVPSGANVQYNDTGWPIAFTIDSVTRNSAVVPFLPPTGNSYVDLVDPETVEGTVFYGGDVTPQTGGQVEWYIVSGTGTVNVMPTGEWVWDAMPGETVVAAFRYIAPDGTLEAFANHTFSAAGDNVPANPGNQSLTNQEPATRVYFTPFEITGADPGEPIPSSLIAGSQAEWQVSTDGGSTYDTSSSAPRTLYNGNFVLASLVTGPDFANVGPNYTAAASINMNGVIVQLSATNRDAAVPSITAQPSNDTVEAGSPGSFIVTMTDAASYQWYLVGTGAVSGATSNTFAPTTASGDAGTTRQYYVIGTSTEGGTVQSDTVTLTITNATTTFTSAEQLRDNETKALLANTLVSYKLITVDGTEITGSATTDASGYLSDSSVDFGTAGDTVIVYGEFGTYITGFKAVLS